MTGRTDASVSSSPLDARARPRPDAATAFSKRYGAAPERVWTAPGRVNLIGEHTDYNDGFVLPLAIPMGTEVAVRRRDDDLVRVSSSQADEIVEFATSALPGDVEGWAAYVAGVVWALAASGVVVAGADLAIDSTVPSGAGLSSSAALEVASLLAVTDGGLGDRTRAARIAQRAEVEFVGMPCGVMDQMASLYGAADHVVFIDTRTDQVRHVPFRLDDDGLALLVVDTKAPHRLVGGEYAERRAQCEEAARLLGVGALRDVTLADIEAASMPAAVRRRARHVVTENARVLEVVDRLMAGSTRAIGELLSESHVSMRDDFENTVPEVDLAFDASLGAGALGARMTGGGFGGCVIALVELPQAAEIAAAVARAFRAAGHAAPEPFTVVASPGAGRATFTTAGSDGSAS